MLIEENDYTCGFCKHYDSDECYCQARGEFEVYEDDSCEYWIEDKDELSEEDKLGIIGDRIAHERMETEGYEVI